MSTGGYGRLSPNRVKGVAETSPLYYLGAFWINVFLTIITCGLWLVVLIGIHFYRKYSKGDSNDLRKYYLDGSRR